MYHHHLESHIVDLYTVSDSEQEGKKTIPFVHNIALMGPKGEVVRMRSVFDDGAMVSAIDRQVYNRVRHRLSSLGPSTRILCMADGCLLPSIGVWTGVVDVDGLTREGNFEVFDSGGAWALLFGKPLLEAFEAIHDYKADFLWFPLSSALENRKSLQNQFLTVSTDTGELVGLTTDIKQRTKFWGGLCASPSRQVHSMSKTISDEQVDQSEIQEHKARPEGWCNRRQRRKKTNAKHAAEEREETTASIEEVEEIEGLDTRTVTRGERFKSPVEASAICG
jgi:hypothetical protein